MKRVSTKWIQLGASVLLGLTMATAQAQTWWKPGVNTTWQWQLTGTLNTSYNVDVYDVDLFDTPTQTIAQLKAACDGDLDRLVRVVKLVGFVNSTADFTDQPKVINGASDLMVEVFGDAGRHARSAVSAASLPLGVAVEIEAIFEVK